MQASASVVFAECGDRCKDWKSVPPLLKNAVRKVHEATLHAAYRSSLVKRFQLAGASKRAVSAAHHFWRELRESTKQHGPRPQAAVPQWRKFIGCIGIDFMIVPDLNKKPHTILVIMDMAAEYVMLLYCNEGSRPTARTARPNLSRWIETFNKPSFGQKDQDPAFQGLGSELFAGIGLLVIPCASEAHWQRGKVENKVRFFKEMATALLLQKASDMPVQPWRVLTTSWRTPKASHLRSGQLDITSRTSLSSRVLKMKHVWFHVLGKPTICGTGYMLRRCAAEHFTRQTRVQPCVLPFYLIFDLNPGRLSKGSGLCITVLGG